MPNVTIRNVDNRVLAKLKQQAKANKRSLAAELRAILTRAAQGDPRTVAERIAAQTPDVAQTDSTDLLRKDRRR